MAMISAVVLALLVGMWMWRGRQIAQLEAVAQFQRFRDQTSAARAMLSLPGPGNPARTEGVELARSILRHYGLPAVPGLARGVGFPSARAPSTDATDA